MGAPSQVSDERGLSCFYIGSFRNFEPLLTANQDYARDRGYRFLGSDFQDVIADSVKYQKCGQVEQSQSASLEAQSMVQRFAKRLTAGELALVEEIERAFRLVMVESVRNAMIGTFKLLEMWPPRKTPIEVHTEDCSYEDMSAPLPVIAQRLYNDEMRRNQHLFGAQAQCPLRQRAVTASFLVDFAHEVGANMPTISETESMMMQEFLTCVKVWEFTLSGEGQTRSRPCRSDGFCGIPVFVA